MTYFLSKPFALPSGGVTAVGVSTVTVGLLVCVRPPRRDGIVDVS